MRDIASNQDAHISLEAKSTAAAVVDEEEDDETDDIVLEDICEVVISLKCKQCQFLCNDKSTLATHIKRTHSKRKIVSESCTRNLTENPKREKNDLENGHSHTAIAQDGPANPSISDDSEMKEKSDKYSEEPKKQKRKQESPSRKDEDQVEVTEHNQSNQSLAVSHEKSNGDNSNESLPVEALLDESVEDVFLCAECDIVFSSREMCCSHMHKVHGLKQFSADFIQEEIISKPTEETQNGRTRGRKSKFPKKIGAVVPKKYRVTKDVFLTCSKCPIKFENAEIMKFHEQCHQSRSNTDEFSRQNKKRSDNNEHGILDLSMTDISTENKIFICPVCESNGMTSQLFPKWTACSWHLWKEHRIDCELYTCSVCKQFKSHLIARVKDHEQLHSTKASYKCKTCNKTFKQLKQLRCHEKYHKDNSTKLAPKVDSRWYTPKECPICQRILSDSKCLKKHISAVHNKLKPYVCNICGHTSARKAELQLHVRQHTGEKPYKCPLCPFQTGDHNSLRKHKLRHSDERPYACTYCDYRCIQSCAFKKHILACHPGQEVVFLCHLCSHASVNETLFAAHQKDHAEGRIAAENPNDSETSPTETQGSLSPSTSNDSGKIGEAVKFWSGDEDSLDIIDNGGVTIPASPQTPVDLHSHGENAAVEKQMLIKVEGNTIPKSTGLMTRFPPETNGSHNKNCKSTSAAITLSKSLSSSIGKTSSRLGVGSSSSHHNRQFLVPQGFRVTTTTSSSLQPLPASPRQEKTNNTSAVHSATNTSEDTESSTSEVITNPHQLIQNIQLTPLDLTDIISCNEQSNDDGMLQRLLDMSGV